MAENYQLLEELGSGSFGIVYKAIEKSTGELVAVKHIDLEGSDDDIREIQQEIALLSTCASQYVTQYKTSFVRGVKLWIVMEYLGGGSCLDLLKPGPFAEAHIAIICRELLRGLDYLHTSNKIHRDIKAANILLSTSGRVKIADFGVAAQLTNIKSQRLTFVGTPFWMAPEVIQEAGYDFKADIWSLGITAVELAKGEPPNASTHPMKVLFMIPKAPAPRLEDGQFCRDFRDFVASCLVKDPDRRPTAKELLRHRFIRNAGKVEALRELIERRQMFDASAEKRAHPKFYEETMKDLTPRAEQEEWIFDTVKPVPVAPRHATQKRRKISRIPSSSTGDQWIHGDDDNDDEYDENATATASSMLERLDLNDGPLSPTTPLPPPRKRRSTRRRSSGATAFRAHSPPGRTPTTARNVSAQRTPLGLNTSFGNSPSAVRQFERVSSTGSNNEAISAKAVDIDASADENTPPPPATATATATAAAAVGESSSRKRSSGRRQPPAAATTKETNLGQALYTSVLDPALQELHAQTATPASRAAIGRLAAAWAELGRVDPSGVFLLLRSVVERVKVEDGALASALGVTGARGDGAGDAERKQVEDRRHDGREEQREVVHSSSALLSTPTSSPTKRPPQSSHRRQQSTPKLVLAPHNPHLKSHHRRRQSALPFVGGSSSSSTSSSALGMGGGNVHVNVRFHGGGSNVSSSSSVMRYENAGSEGGRGRERQSVMTREAGEEERRRKVRLPGQTPPGMEQAGGLTDVLYGRWVEGLRGRWGAAA